MSAADNYRDTLIAIIEKSATLAERLSGEFVPINDPTEAEIIETRLSTWIQTAAHGDPERFRKRLEWDGLTLEQVKPLLGSVRRRDPDALLPRWAEFLGEVLAGAKNIAPKGAYDFYLDPKKLIPFEEILTSFVQAAGGIVWQSHLQPLFLEPHQELIFGRQAISGFQHSLLHHLSEISTPSFKIAFKTFQIIQFGGSFLEASDKSNEHYSAFVEANLQGELEGFLTQYPTLARLMASRALFWADSLIEFLDRLLHDSHALCDTFAILRPLVLENTRPSLSDFHHNGRSVIQACLSISHDVTYKPKSLGLETALNNLASWLENHGVTSLLLSLKIISHENYSWMEFVQKPYFNTVTHNYYGQSGRFLALVHALAANDCHSDNIINNGKQPVLIDAETLMHHRVPNIEYHFKDARAAAHAILENSVLRTQFLPKWEFTADGIAYDMSGIEGISTESHDDVASVLSLIIPGLEFKKPNPNEHETEIIGGFTEMYRFLMAHREELLAEGSPLEGFKNQRVRYVFRPTQTYQTVLQHTLQPRYLHEGIDRSIQIESLNRVLLAWDEKPVYWDIHKGEAQAMEQMDVPLLTYNSSDTSLHIGDITIENVFDRPAYTLVVERLNAMSKADLQQQIAFIRGSLFCRIAHELPDTQDEIPSVLQNAPTLPPELLTSEAGQIADELQARAIWGEDGSATWITLTYHFAANRYQFGQISDGLYDGTCGVAFFLAALHHVTGWPGARELGLAAIKPLQNRLYHPVLSQRLARNLGVNGPSGLKSIAYALRQISAWLDEPRLLDDVPRVESLISPERDIVEQQAGRIPENVFAQSAGRWRIESRLPDGVQLWGLYGGRAGIGYELLKLLDTSLPSIPF